MNVLNEKFKKIKYEKNIKKKLNIKYYKNIFIIVIH